MELYHTLDIANCHVKANAVLIAYHIEVTINASGLTFKFYIRIPRTSHYLIWDYMYCYRHFIARDSKLSITCCQLDMAQHVKCCELVHVGGTNFVDVKSPCHTVLFQPSMAYFYDVYFNMSKLLYALSF